MNWKKIAIIGGAALLLIIIVVVSVVQSRKGVVAVQTGKVAKQDVATVVTASGQVKPKLSVNIGANAMGKITRLFVKEGDHVKQGQMLAQLENVQSQADVEAQTAAVSTARTDAVASDAAVRTAAADLNRAKSDVDRTKLEYDRAAELYKAQLIPKSDYDVKRTAYDSATAGLAQAEARLAQARAQKESSERRINQASATLTRASDILSKTSYRAPFDGVITNLPVHESETVVMGIQNAPGSTLMTLDDMSIVTVEVKVDETDIVNVKLNQPAEITIDALPKQTFKGKVTEIGNIAVLRSTGVATSQSLAGSTEAKDFKVVVTIQDPPENLRPGLSATAKITTASKQDVLTIPIQAITIRRESELKPKTTGTGVQAAAPATPKDDKEVTGVFVINPKTKKAEFVAVETGVTGTTDVELLKGPKQGDEIITGSYRVLRTLKNNTSVKVDNSGPVREENKS